MLPTQYTLRPSIDVVQDAQYQRWPRMPVFDNWLKSFQLWTFLILPVWPISVPRQQPTLPSLMRKTPPAIWQANCELLATAHCRHYYPTVRVVSSRIADS
jgi:hypothetical protein